MSVCNSIEIQHDSRTQVTFAWENPTGPVCKIVFKLIKICPSEERVVQMVSLKPSRTTRTCKNLKKGFSYRVEITFVKNKSAAKSTPSMGHVGTTTSEVLFQNFRPVFSTGELQQLHGMAVQFIGESCSKSRCRDFLRNKPPAYYDYIMNYQNGVMRPYVKDHHGDKCNPANRQLPGLFFSTDPSPSPKSHFGTKRLLVKASILFNRDTNLYFSDFYCNNKDHYVTLVLTKIGSHADDFCHQHLYQLNQFNNPYLVLVQSHHGELRMEVAVRQRFWVEVFYTENVHIQLGHAGYRFSDVEKSGKRGHSKYTGMGKRTRCEICNL